MASRKLSNYLSTYRKRAGLSQNEVAFLLGCQDGNKASRYERRIRKPNLETILAYELLFGVPARELFAGIYQKVESSTVKRVQLLAEKLGAAQPNRLRARKLELLNAIASPPEAEPQTIDEKTSY